MEKSIAWTEGSGSITLTYTGEGNGTVSVSSDPNDVYYERSQTVSLKTLDGSIERTVTVSQGMREPNLRTSDGRWIVTADEKYVIVKE